MAKGRYGKKGNGILAFILCLPLAFIVYFLISYSSHTITLDNVKKITVVVPNADEVLLESSADVDFYVEALTKGTPISSAVRDVENEEPVKIICQREDKSIEYKLYPSLNLSGCMLVAPEGELYVLKTESARSLLLRSEFDYLYADYFLPQLSVVSGDKTYDISPLECDWSYIKSDDKTYSYVPKSYAAGTERYSILKGLENNLRFGNGEQKPDNFDITFIAENGTEYESISDISELNLSVDTNVTITIDASWSNRNGAKSYGSAKYKFTVLYDVPAKIEINKNEFALGDVIEVYGSHLNADEQVKLETLLNYSGFDGFGMLERDLGVALIPIGLDNNSGEATLEFLTDASSVLLDIALSEKQLNTSFTSVPMDLEQYEKQFASSVIKEFENALSWLTSPDNRPSKDDYFNYKNANFTKPVSKGQLKYQFGQKVNMGVVGDVSDSGNRIVNGVVYSANQGDAVCSMESGEVVYIGEFDTTGKTMVIYHGYGIYSYYYHLSDFAVELSVGSSVNCGQTIGYVGSVQLGVNNSSSVLHFATSINGVFVDPEWFLNK